MRSQRAAAAGALLVALLAAAGCGDKKTAEVNGAITVDGKPVESGVITFVPVDGKTTTAGGKIEGGRYSARVPVGTMKVSISAPKVVGRKKIYPTPDSPEMPVTAEALPARYNERTELRLDVKPGRNPKDWDLQGK